MKNEKLAESAEEKRRKAAILRDRDTMPMDFEAKSRVAVTDAKQRPGKHSQESRAGESDPLWKQVWKTEGIRYLGREGNGVIDAMERFEHGFMHGYRYGVSDMLSETQKIIKEGRP